MATTSNRSSGTQITQRGVNQGNVLVDPVTGLPISVVTDTNGKKRLAVDANFTAQNVQAQVELDYHEDSVQLGDPNTGSTLKIHPDGSIDANVEVDAADGDNIAIHDSTGNELKVNPDGSINVNTYEKMFALLVNANFIKLGNYDQVIPTFATNLATLGYYESGAKIAQAQIQFVNSTNWSMSLEAYINNDDGLILEDDNNNSLLLE